MQLGDRMLRLTAFRDKDGYKDYFVMTTHHAIYDGWMLWLLFSAIRRVYLDLPKLETSPYNVFGNHRVARDHECNQRFWQSYVCYASLPSWPELYFRPRSTSVRKRTAAFPRGGQQNFTPYNLDALCVWHPSRSLLPRR